MWVWPENDERCIGVCLCLPPNGDTLLVTHLQLWGCTQLGTVPDLLIGSDDGNCVKTLFRVCPPLGGIGYMPYWIVEYCSTSTNWRITVKNVCPHLDSSVFFNLLLPRLEAITGRCVCVWVWGGSIRLYFLGEWLVISAFILPIWNKIKF